MSNKNKNIDTEKETVKTSIDETNVEETTPAVEEVVETPVPEVKEVKAEEPKKDKPVAPVTPVAPNTTEKVASTDVKVGDMVRLKETAKSVVSELPKFAFKNTYKVEKILPSRLVLKAGNYTIAVTKDSVTK